jgi:hypothetical protein
MEMISANYSDLASVSIELPAARHDPVFLQTVDRVTHQDSIALPSWSDGPSIAD